MTARLPLGLIASHPRQVSEHTILMGHTCTQSSTRIFVKMRKSAKENGVREEGSEESQETEDGIIKKATHPHI